MCVDVRQLGSNAFIGCLHCRVCTQGFPQSLLQISIFAAELIGLCLQYRLFAAQLLNLPAFFGNVSNPNSDHFLLFAQRRFD